MYHYRTISRCDEIGCDAEVEGPEQLVDLQKAFQIFTPPGWKLIAISGDNTSERRLVCPLHQEIGLKTLRPISPKIIETNGAE